jgi:hypothetical protein
MNNGYVSFNQLLKNAMARISESQRVDSEGHRKFRREMRKTFNDPEMFTQGEQRPDHGLTNNRWMMWRISR